MALVFVLSSFSLESSVKGEEIYVDCFEAATSAENAACVSWGCNDNVCNLCLYMEK